MKAIVAVVAMTLLAGAPAHAAPDYRIPQSDRFHVFYAYSARQGPVPGRMAAIAANVATVDAWFAAQLGGPSLRLVTRKDAVVVTPLPLPLSRRAFDAREDVVWDFIREWRRAGLIAPNELPIVYVEGYQTYDACAWSWDGRRGPYIAIPMASCDIRPKVSDTIRSYGPYLLAHEVAHALGAASDTAPHSDGTGHVTDDPGDIVFGGGWDEVDWENLALDVGQDDYLRTGRSDVTNIETSPLLEPAREPVQGDVRAPGP